jgi:hypothetical protein
VAATLTASGTGVTGRAGGVTLQSSPNASTWTTETVSIAEDAPGHYSAALSTLTTSRYYRLRFAGEATLLPADSAASAQLLVTPATVAWSYVATAATFPYSESAVIAGSLSATSPLTGAASAVALQQSANGTSGWTTATATVTEDAPAHYAAALNPAGTGAYYRLVYAGVPSQYASATSPVVRLTSVAVITGWTGEHTSAATVAYGATGTALSATLQYTGPVTGQTPRVTLVSSTDGSTWTTETATVAETPAGTYGVTLPAQLTPGAKDYRFRFAGQSGMYAASDSASIRVTVNKIATAWSSTSNSRTALNAGIDNFELSGTLQDGNGAPMSNAAVVVKTSPANDGTTWTETPATISQPGPGQYRAVLSNLTTDTLVQLTYVGDATHAASSWQAPTVTVSFGNLHFDTATVSSATLPYGAASLFSAQLWFGESPTSNPGSATVVLQQSYYANGAGASTVRQAAGDSSGLFSAVTSGVLVKTYFRLHSDGTLTSPAFDTAWIPVTPFAYLTAPVTPSKVTHNKTFAVTGKVSRSPLGTRVVTLTAEHKETKIVKKKKTYVWVVRATTVYRATPGTSVASYKVNMKLKQTGSWRIKAKVSDVWSIPVTTGYRSFSAK